MWNFYSNVVYLSRFLFPAVFSIIFVIITEVHERIEIFKKKYVQVQYDIYVYKINDVQEY